MEQWSASFDAYQLGRLKDASIKTEIAMNSSEPSSLLTAALLTNSAALNGQRTSSPPLPPLSSSLTPEYLFRTEISLTRSYNAALAAARKGNIRAASNLLRKSSLVFDSLALPSPTILSTHGSLSLPQDTPLNFVHRVCSAYSAVLQLRSALMLMEIDDGNDANPAGTFEIASQAKAWQRASLSLSTGAEPTSENGDRNLARAAGILSLTKAVGGDYAGAIDDIAPHAELSEDQPEIQPNWPAVYQHGAFRALRSLKNDSGVAYKTGKSGETDETVISQLEAAARAGYRASDAYSLVARLHRESSRALRSFQSALALEHDRPSTLVAAAAAFGKEGNHAAETELLACATELRSTAASKYDVVLVKPWKPNRITVNLMKAKSLLLNGNPAGALNILESVEKEPKFMKERARIGLAATAQVVGKDNSRAMKKTVDKYRLLGCVTAGAELAAADVRTCEGDIAGAREIIDKLTRTVVDGDEELLRGICYNNSGVLDMCASGSGSPGDNFAAAQVAFDKCDGKWAEEAADAATWNRTLALAEAGRLEEGASHWIGRRKEKRGLISSDNASTQFKKTKHHVMGRVCEEDKAAMDEICRKIEESAKMQKELEDVMKDSGGQW